MENSPENMLEQLKEDVKTLVELKVELLKLNVYDRFARIIAIVSLSLLLVLIFFSLIFYLFGALGYFLGELLNSVALGFVLVSALYLLIALLIIAFRKGFQSMIMDSVFKAIMVHEKRKEKENEEDETLG